MKGQLIMWDIVGAIARVVGAVIALCRYIHEIRKDKKQKSNRPSLPKE